MTRSRDPSPFRVVVTGSECTGKTTLARALAARFDSPLSEEFARLHAERKTSSLGPEDLEPIARGQIVAEDAALAEARRRRSALVVHDTDLVSTAIYARHYPYYRGGPDWIPAAAVERLADLYLLCLHDVPWLPDGVRDRPDDRAALHVLFESALAGALARVALISGPGEERLARAERAIARCLSGRTTSVRPTRQNGRMTSGPRRTS